MPRIAVVIETSKVLTISLTPAVYDVSPKALKKVRMFTHYSDSPTKDIDLTYTAKAKNQATDEA